MAAGEPAGADSALASFALEGEGPTLAGVIAERLNRDPRVAFAAYTVPHPSEKRVIVQVGEGPPGSPLVVVLKGCVGGSRHIRPQCRKNPKF